MQTLASFRDVHAGQAILVCGCGASLNLLERPGDFITIGVNDVGRKFDPDYLVVVDPPANFRDDRFSYVVSSRARHLFTQRDDLGFSHPGEVRFRLGRRDGTDFSNPEVLDYGVTTPYVAVCLAIHMGASNIGLIGIDFTDHHFFGATGTHPWTPHLATVEAQSARLAQAAAARGVRIFNLSPDSRLMAVPRMRLDGFAHLAAQTPAPAARADAPALRIVSYATRPLGGAPWTLARCINDRTRHLARCVWASAGAGDRWPDAIAWTTQAALARRELETADLVVVHDGKVDASHASLLARKPVLTVAHHELAAVDTRWVQAGFAGVVAARRLAMRPEFRDWRTVPDLLAWWESGSPAQPDPSTLLETRLDLGPEPLAAQGCANPAWMQQHRDFASQWQDHWWPAVAHTLGMDAARRPCALPPRPAAVPTASIVLATRNEGELLCRTVQGLLAGTPDDVEIVVVDDGSQDGSADALPGAGERVRVIRQPAPAGCARARNAGAAAARGQVLVFSDAHVAMSTAWLGALSLVLADADVGAVAPAVRSLRWPQDFEQGVVHDPAAALGYGLHWRSAELRTEWLGRVADQPHDVPLLSGACVALRRSVFASVGGYDDAPGAAGAEDAELCLRLWRLGYRCVVHPGVTAAHLFRAQRTYPLGWEPVLYGRMRLAAIHLDAQRREQVTDALRRHDGFRAARARLDTDDNRERAARWSALAARDSDAFFRQFPLATWGEPRQP